MTSSPTTPPLPAMLKLSAIIVELRKVSADMPMQQLDLYLRIVQRPGIGMDELAPLLGISQSSVSRNVAALSKFHRLGKPGLDLVEVRLDPRDSRRREIWLSPLGKKLADRLSKMLDPNYVAGTYPDADEKAEALYQAELAKMQAMQPKRGQITKL